MFKRNLKDQVKVELNFIQEDKVREIIRDEIRKNDWRKLIDSLKPGMTMETAGLKFKVDTVEPAVSPWPGRVCGQKVKLSIGKQTKELTLEYHKILDLKVIND